MAGKYQIRIHGTFESAHYLYDYHGPGKNESLHGHSYKVEIFIRSVTLENGIGVDFVKVQKKLDVLTGELDHKCINAVAPFKEINPTAENLARHFFDKLGNSIAEGSFIYEVRVWEGPNNHASYFP
ncbi:MAG: 6-carboxytetrahydropterin synthase [Leptospirales bacterium]